MAKKVIQAQMQQRRDTAANWAASNPVLLEGELGIVTDDPNLYKIGDGVTAWNDLKLRGFDGTLVQTTGDSENAAMSQKAVTSKLTELESRVGSDGANYDASILTIFGYINPDGNITNSSAYKYSELIPALPGQIVKVGVNMSAGICCLAFYDKKMRFVEGYVGEAYKYTIVEKEIPQGVAFIRFCHVLSNDAFSASLSKSGTIQQIYSLSKITESNSEELVDLGNSLKGTINVQPKDAWVRYSDGLINVSAGGAKIYVIKRTDIPLATKIYAQVCTESTTFAAIAFYSSDSPSVDSYMQEASVQGKNTTELNNYIAVIPNECKSIVVLNMSQLQPNCLIQTDQLMYVPAFQKQEIINECKTLFNPFFDKNAYYHLNQENDGASKEYGNTWIPAQSLADIAFAAQLGFNMIEANVHKCSDGVFICKHGKSGTFGAGLKSLNGQDYENITISSVSSSEVKNNIRYDSFKEKYCTTIPTLDEFCAVCKKFNLAVKTEYKNGVLPIMRKYLSDDKIFLVGISERGDFRGPVEMVWTPTDNMEDFASRCKDIGAPIQVIIASGYFPSLTDEQVMDLVSWSHKNGYTVSVPYLTTTQWLKAQSLGVDVCLSTERIIPLFLVGNHINICQLYDDNMKLQDGASYNEDEDIIDMPQWSRIVVPVDRLEYGAVSLDICVKGDVRIRFGHNAETINANIVSDGEEIVSISNAITPILNNRYASYYLEIEAYQDTILKSLKVRCSRL